MKSKAFLLPLAAPALAQSESEGNRPMNPKSAISVPSGANGLAKVLGAAVLSIVILIAVVALLRGRERPCTREDEPQRKKDPPGEGF